MTYRASSPPVLVVAFNGHVFGLEAASGKRLWHRKGDGTPMPPRVLVHGDQVLVAGLEDLVLLCLDLATGAEVWRCATHVFGNTLLVADARVYLTGNGTAECVSLDGQSLWYDGFEGCGHGGVALAVPGQTVNPDT